MIWQISENPIQNFRSLFFKKYTNYIAQGCQTFVIFFVGSGDSKKRLKG